MKTGLAQSHFAVTPGQPTFINIEVTNTADVIDGVTAIVDGINPDWIRLERPMLSLFPDASDMMTLVFDIPKTCPAGDYLVVVRLVSTIDFDRQSVHDFWLTVGVVTGVELDLRPSIVTGGAEERLDATITNTGNAPATITVTALEPTREVDCQIDPSTFVIGPGSPAVLPVVLRGPRPWFGQPAARQIHITAQIDDVVVEKIATFNQKPRIPRGLLTALMLIGIILLWALIFLWVVSEMRSSEPSAKATGTFLVGGPENIPLSAIAGTIEGTVTAATTGQGLPRITVEAIRIDAAGEAVSVGSGATGDDGAYLLPSLIPGDYRLRFSADGFTPQTYVAADGSDILAVAPIDPTTGIDVVMVGTESFITGKIALPPGSEGVPLEVEARMIVENSEDATQEIPSATQTTTDGTINLGPLPTPADYLVTVTGEGFATQQFEQSLGGSGNSVINTVNLTAADGTIGGLVVDENDQPLGGVQVTARSGATELKAITPTAGNTGEFRFVGLVTPETYVLTFDLTGFTSQTKALSLAAGGSTIVSARLVGGSGTVTGLAVTPQGDPIGGITVSITGESFTGETSTLTSTGAGGGAGSFTVSGMPVPGEYTVTFTGTGVQNETLAASFTTAGTQDLGSVVLLPLTSQVRGTVRAAGAGLGEVSVTLTDGELSQITTSATSPAGSFSFSGVPAGAYTLTFKRSGYATQVVLVQVAAGVDTTTDVSMAAGS